MKSLCVLVAVIVVLVFRTNATEIMPKVDGDYDGNQDFPTKKKADRPHIVFMMTDDMGWNDIGWNNPLIRSPNLNQLAEEGVKLDNYYAQTMCTPTRAALLTGTYPHRFGYQQVLSTQPIGLPQELTTLPEKLRELGYTSHLLGKWHLGLCKDEYTPLGAGFNTFYGYYSHSINWFNKYGGTGFLPNRTLVKGYDFRDNTGIVTDDKTHIELLMRDRALDIIQKLPDGQPLSMFYFTGMPHEPLEVPQKYVDFYDPADVPSEERRKYMGMVSLFDESVGAIVQALKEKGIWEDTIFIFASDNGGDPIYQGDNNPLRSGKGYLYDGGSRVPAMVHGKILKKTGYTNHELIHVSDWYNTLLSAAGGYLDKNMDSIDQLRTIVWGDRSRRNTIIYNSNLPADKNASAIRHGDYKLIRGDPRVNTIPLAAFALTPEEEIIAYNLTSHDVLELYYLPDDPSEKNNIADQLPDIVSYLDYILDEVLLETTPSMAINTPFSYEANPANFGGVWSTGWC